MRPAERAESAFHVQPLALDGLHLLRTPDQGYILPGAAKERTQGTADGARAYDSNVSRGMCSFRAQIRMAALQRPLAWTERCEEAYPS